MVVVKRDLIERQVFAMCKNEKYRFLKTFAFFTAVIVINNYVKSPMENTQKMDYILKEWIFPIIIAIVFSKLIAMKAVGKLIWGKKHE